MNHELPDGARDRATQWVTASSVGYDVTPVSIFLGGERQVDGSRSFNFMIRREIIVQLARAKEKRDIVQSEGLVVRCCSSVLPRS